MIVRWRFVGENEPQSAVHRGNGGPETAPDLAGLPGVSSSLGLDQVHVHWYSQDPTSQRLLLLRLPPAWPGRPQRAARLSGGRRSASPAPHAQPFAIAMRAGQSQVDHVDDPLTIWTSDPHVSMITELPYSHSGSGHAVAVSLYTDCEECRPTARYCFGSRRRRGRIPPARPRVHVSGLRHGDQCTFKII